MAELLETFYELARAGRTDPEGKPSMLQIAVSFSALRDDIRTVIAPWPAQRALFRARADRPRSWPATVLRDGRVGTVAAGRAGTRIAIPARKPGDTQRRLRRPSR